jgi:hypothetical protein
MPIRPFKEIPRNSVEWAKFFRSTEVTPDPDTVGSDSIVDRSVTFQKIQEVQPDRLLGRDTSPAGSVQELTVGGGLEFTGAGIQRSAFTGDITVAAGSTVTAFRSVAATSVIGRSANTEGTPADITATTNGHYFRRSGDVLGFDAIADADIPANFARQTSGTFSGILTGCTTNPSGTIRWVKVGSLVCLYIPTIVGTSNTTDCTITGLPASLFPAIEQVCVARLQDNSVIAFGLVGVDAAGVINLYTGPDGGVFTNVNQKGIFRTTITYLIT